VRVPERVPRYPPRLPDPVARWCELPVVQVFVAKRSAFRCLKHQFLGTRRIHPRAVIFKHALKRRADGKHPPAALGFRRTEFARGIVLRHFEGGAEQIDALPTQPKDLADPQAGQNRNRYH
jgi:hypothetical protein